MYIRRSLGMKVELTTIELKALELKDINNFNDKKCANIMDIDIKEYNNILNNARAKITKALIDGAEISIIEINLNDEPKCNTLCKFRCAVCGQIYEIDYTKEDIKCRSEENTSELQSRFDIVCR